MQLYIYAETHGDLVRRFKDLVDCSVKTTDGMDKVKCTFKSIIYKVCVNTLSIRENFTWKIRILRDGMVPTRLASTSATGSIISAVSLVLHVYCRVKTVD